MGRRKVNGRTRFWGWLKNRDGHIITFWRLPEDARFKYKWIGTYENPRTTTDLEIEKVDKGYRSFNPFEWPELTQQMYQDYHWTLVNNEWHTGLEDDKPLEQEVLTLEKRVLLFTE